MSTIDERLVAQQRFVQNSSLGFLLAAIRLSRGIVEVLGDVLIMVARKVAEMRSVNRWGARPTEQQQAKLERMLHQWETEGNHGDRRGPFDGEVLNGAEVFWLAVQATRSRIRETEAEIEQFLRDLSTSGSIKPFRLSELHLEGASLEKARLERANLLQAHLNGANLVRAHLEDAYLQWAHLQGVDLRGGHLRGSNLVDANLQGAVVAGAGLQQANFYKADLRKGDFAEANLCGSSLMEADLRGANLSHAIFDIEANLADAKLGNRENGFAAVTDTAWNGVILTSVDWSGLFRKHWWSPLSGGKLGDDQRDPRTTARAHRQLALALRAQGLNAEAAELDYRAHIRARRNLWRKGQFSAYLASWLACIVAGYGYRLGRCFAFYASVVVLVPPH